MPASKAILRSIVFGGTLIMGSLHAWADPTYTVIHHFTGHDGGGDPAVLIGHQAVPGVSSSFTLFGVTLLGGGAKGGTVCQNVFNGCGIAFQLTPPAAGAPAWAWTESRLYAFQGTDGAQPDGLVLDSTGELFGTTFSTRPEADDPSGGTVFRLIPPPPNLGYFWYHTTLYKIGAQEDGQNPMSLTLGRDGSIYTVNYLNAISTNTAVYRFTPPASGTGAWSKTLLHAFTGGADGTWVVGSLVSGVSGTLYGVTNNGGIGFGSVFSLSPPISGKTNWRFATLHSFTDNARDGGKPNGGLLQSKTGALYGTTASAGPANNGTVFKMTPPPAGQTTWTETTLLTFDANAGSYPNSALVEDGAGALYGIEEVGTQTSGTPGNGAVFKVSPPTVGKTAWTYTVLHNFSGPPSDGLSPNTLTIDPSGNLYGTTGFGGIYGYGIAFKIAP